MKIDLPLMENNITRPDLDAVIEFLKGEPILTNSKKCLEFEHAWSKWLGTKYSVFVNSGSSANILTLAMLEEIFEDGEIIVPTLTWVSDIVAVLKTKFKPVFVDIDLHHLGMEEAGIYKAITPKTRAVFLTHILGFNALSDKLLKTLREKNILLIEDVCESHGATFKGKKLGTYGEISNFSFYFAHHMSTIEGGMICTDDERYYQMARLLRSHGMVRESTNDSLKMEYAQAHSDLRPEFIFAYPGFNFRSTEINAVIGLSQLPRLDANNERRRENFNLFLELLDSKKYFTEFDVEGSCNYAFTLVLRKPDAAFCDRVIQALRNANVEFRRGTSGGGNQLRQPYLIKRFGKFDMTKYPNVDFIHFYGFYLGNYPSLPQEKIKNLCKLLNAVE